MDDEYWPPLIFSVILMATLKSVIPTGLTATTVGSFGPTPPSHTISAKSVQNRTAAVASTIARVWRTVSRRGRFGAM